MARRRWTEPPSLHDLIADADDLPLHPEALRWLVAYAEAPEADRDATVAEILQAVNLLLVRAERDRTMLAEAQQLARFGTWEWQRGDTVATWSPALYRIWGLDPRTFQPTHDNVRSQIHPDDRATFDAMRAATIRSGQASEGAFRVIRPDGEIGYLAASMTAIRDADGRLARLHGVTLDITELTMIKQERAEQRER
jgi:PAS domain S-box-containing protein